MEILIIIAIAALALLLTGLTDFQALRRPFRSKSERAENPAEGASVPPNKAAFGNSDDQSKERRRGA